jgi:hypothetical protein
MQNDTCHPKENEMLSMQQCIDMCELSSEQAPATHEQVGLQDIFAIQAASSNVARDSLNTSEHLLLGLQNDLLSKVNSADTFDDLAVALNQYQALIEYRERVGA